MTLTLGPILSSAVIDPSEALMSRHITVPVHEDTGLPEIHAESSDEEILDYTRRQSVDRKKFPAQPPLSWAVLIREDGKGARLWSVVDNGGETPNDGEERFFDLARSALAGVQFQWTKGGTISTAVTGASEGALACAELSDWEDLEFVEALALQEIRWADEIRRSYVWFLVGPADDLLSHVPRPVRLDLIECALERLDAPRSGAEVAALPLRSLTLFEGPAPTGELEELRPSVNDSWRSFD